MFKMIAQRPMKLPRALLLVLSLAASAGIVSAQTNTFPSSGNVGIGTATPVSRLVATGVSSPANDAGIFQITTGTGANTDNKLTFGVSDAGYSWIQVEPDQAGRNPGQDTGVRGYSASAARPAH